MINQDTVKELLVPGDIIPNFKTLCEMFEVPYYVKSSDSGKAIVKQLQQYCNLEFKGQKVLVTDIYNEPKAMQDGRWASGARTFIPYIEIVLSAYLATTADNKAFLTFKQLYEILGFHNEHFGDKETCTSENLKVEEISLRSFYARSLGQFKKVVNRALNNLAHRALIEYSVERIIVLPDGTSFVANDRQTKAVLNIENDILNKMGLYDKRIAALRGMTGLYQSRVNAELRRQHGWDYSYQRIKIIGADSFRLLRDMDRNLAKMKLNKEIVGMINGNAATELASNWKQYKEGKLKHCFPGQYLQEQYKLSRCLISMDPVDEEYLQEVLAEPTDWELFS